MTKYYREQTLTDTLARMRERGINDVPGLYTGEPDFLCKMARLAPDGVGLEIGVRFGHSIITWGAERAGRGPIVGIELEDRPLMRENITESGLEIEVVIGDSATVPVGVTDLSFLFIDGDHRTKGLHADIRRFIPLLIPGGVVVFHDYKHDKRRYPEFRVTECVKAWQRRARWEKLGRVRHCIAFRRPV